MSCVPHFTSPNWTARYGDGLFLHNPKLLPSTCTFMLISFGKSADAQCRYGRKPAVLAPYFVAACFSFGTATAKDIQTVLLTRFFAGLFGSAPVTNTGGVLGDIWSPQQRGTAIVFYAFAVVGGPTLGVCYSSFFVFRLKPNCHP